MAANSPTTKFSGRRRLAIITLATLASWTPIVAAACMRF